MQNNGHDATRLNSSMHEYVAYLHPLNHTNVTGSAKFEQSGDHLKVTIHATGLEPGTHPQHIHGKRQAAAECPTTAADLNKDGFVSVIEGAPSYGLIKMNLTSPQTPFGAPPTLALFEPFAGTANNANFPVVGTDGVLNFTSNYTFDDSVAAQQALASLTPLGDQELVLHGASAPKSVDADAFAAIGNPYPAGTDLSVVAYDALLPAACGEIDEASSAVNTPEDTGGSITTVPAAVNSLNSGLNALQTQLTDGLTIATANVTDASAFKAQASTASTTFSTKAQAAVATYQANISGGMNRDEARNQLINTLSSAKDAELNTLTEARNQQIDQLNKAGNVANRDAFLNGFDTTLNQYKNVLEQAKNQL